MTKHDGDHERFLSEVAQAKRPADVVLMSPVDFHMAHYRLRG